MTAVKLKGDSYPIIKNISEWFTESFETVFLE
jgi:hypothetical protein